MEELKDKQITCIDCGKAFTFTVNDQKFYKEKGFANEPKRCRECRTRKKQEREVRTHEQREEN